MKLIAPKPFTIESGKRAVLLLHGFTGNTNDVKRLGKYLADRNYTCLLYTSDAADEEFAV